VAYYYFRHIIVDDDDLFIGLFVVVYSGIKLSEHGLHTLAGDTKLSCESIDAGAVTSTAGKKLHAAGAQEIHGRNGVHQSLNIGFTTAQESSLASWEAVAKAEAKVLPACSLTKTRLARQLSNGGMILTEVASK